MLKLENVTIQLKNINKIVESPEIAALIKEIDQTIKETAAAYNPTEKKQLAAIKKYLNNKKLDIRPLLKTWTPLIDKKQVAFTDSYSLFILNKELLPYKVSFPADTPEEEKKDFLQKNNINKIDVEEGCYPNIKNLIPNEMDQLGWFKVDINEFLSWYKVQDKSDIKKNLILYEVKNNDYKMNFNADMIKNTIDILQLKDSFILEFYGDYKPGIIRKTNGELGLLLPVKTY